MTPRRRRSNVRKKEPKGPRALPPSKDTFSRAEIERIKSTIRLPFELERGIGNKAGSIARRAAEEAGIWNQLSEPDKAYFVSMVRTLLIKSQEYALFHSSQSKKFGESIKKWPLDKRRALAYSMVRVTKLIDAIEDVGKQFEVHGLVERLLRIKQEG